QKWGGGGHASAAAATLRDVSDSPRIMAEIVSELKTRLPQPITARELMSSPVRTIPPETTITEAHRMLLRYGHSGLSVVDTQGQLVGIISRRDLDIALHHGFGHAPVKGYMTPQLKTITPETTLQQIEELMVNYDIGRLPVLENENLVGIVTRTDVLRELHQQQRPQRIDRGCIPGKTCTSIQHILEDNFNPQLWQVLSKLAELAEKKKWQLYLIGGAVRDLLFMYQNHQLKTNHSLLLTDIDLVVDSCHQAPVCINDDDTPEDCEENYSPAVELAHALQEYYPGARVNIHGEFQTAALLWHNDPVLESLWIDIATARTEFYPYPAANPEVEASDLRQDLYRRDFTINALA
ncbi:MAG: CBS domain-containing protein, partial [Microcoleaceae cyanobacterium]